MVHVMLDKDFSVFSLRQRLVYQPQPNSPKSWTARFLVSFAKIDYLAMLSSTVMLTRTRHR